MENLEMDLPGSDVLSDPRRKVPRWYLHDGSTPLESQSCGIAARLMVSGLLFDKSIGRAVIKDIGPGALVFWLLRVLSCPRLSVCRSPRVLYLIAR